MYRLCIYIYVCVYTYEISLKINLESYNLSSSRELTNTGCINYLIEVDANRDRISYV